MRACGQLKLPAYVQLLTPSLRLFAGFSGQEKQQQTKESIANIKVMILKRDQPPVMTDSVALIEYIVEVGRKEGLIFDGMTSKTPDGKSNLSRIPITMKAHGPYKAITNFLQKLDTVEALFVIDTLLITSDPTKNVEASLQPVELKNMLREDNEEKTFSQEDALSLTEHKKGGYFKGPRAV